MKEWIGELTHDELVTPEAQQSLEKYNSHEEALVGGLNAMKVVGKPYKLPKTMADVEHWPNEKDRQSFHAGMKELRGSVKSVDDLKDVNFAEGLADARHVSEDLVKAVKEFAVEKGYSKKDVQELASMNNKVFTQVFNAQKAATDQAVKANEEKVITGLEALYGGPDGVSKCKENVGRMLQNHCGLSSEEFDQASDLLIGIATTKNLVLSKALFNLSEGYKEGTTGKPNAPSIPGAGEEITIEEELPDLAKAAGWK